MIAFASYVPDFKSIVEKKKYLENNFDTWAFVRK
jgi:hypothetical protein